MNQFYQRSIAFCFLFCCLPALQAIELDLSMQNETAITRLTDSDWKILKSTAKHLVINGTAGDSETWTSSETSHGGVITVVSAKSSAQQECRQLKFLVSAEELTNSSLVNVCKVDGKWTQQALLDSDNLITEQIAPLPNSSSILYQDQLESDEINMQSLDDKSEYCLELANKIEMLKGNPIKHAAAVQERELNCQ